MAFTFPTSPSAGDTFQHGGLEFVYRASPSRWAVNGYNGIPDPFADFNATDFVFRDAMADYADVVFSSQTWPFRTQSFPLLRTGRILLNQWLHFLIKILKVYGTHM